MSMKWAWYHLQKLVVRLKWDNVTTIKINIIVAALSTLHVWSYLIYLVLQERRYSHFHSRITEKIKWWVAMLRLKPRQSAVTAFVQISQKWGGKTVGVIPSSVLVGTVISTTVLTYSWGRVPMRPHLMSSVKGARRA